MILFNGQRIGSYKLRGGAAAERSVVVLKKVHEWITRGTSGVQSQYICLSTLTSGRRMGNMMRGVSARDKVNTDNLDSSLKGKIFKIL